LAQRDRRCLRQNVGVAPHSRSASDERSSREFGFQRGELVSDIEHATVFRANRLWTIGIHGRATFCTFQMSNTCHDGKFSIRNRTCIHGGRASPLGRKSVATRVLLHWELSIQSKIQLKDVDSRLSKQA